MFAMKRLAIVLLASLLITNGVLCYDDYDDQPVREKEEEEEEEAYKYQEEGHDDDDNGGIVYNRHTKVTLTKLSKRLTEGFYLDAETGEALKFSTRPEGVVSISTGSGRYLIRMSPPFQIKATKEGEEDVEIRVTDAAVVEIAGHYFLREKDGDAEMDYYVAASDASLLGDEILSQTNERKINTDTVRSLLKGIDKNDRSYHDKAVRNALNALVSDPNFHLLHDAVKYMGENMHLTGNKYPSLLKLYLVTMKLEELAAGRKGEGEEKREKSSVARHFDSYILRGVTLPDNLYCLRTCPTPCSHMSCLGMCGKGCSCWRFVCGDCCYHYGCFEHDEICRACGLHHIKCILGALKVYNKCNSKKVPHLNNSCYHG